TTQALLDKCYSAERGLFFDLAGRVEEPLRTSTVSSLMPLVLPNLPRPVAEALVAHLADPEDYGAAFPIPSVSMREPAFCAGPVGGKLVWRGPTWMNTNWYLWRGLRLHGYTDLARTIADRSAELVLRSGLREYYNPHTGEGYGARDFSWSGIVLDMLIETS